MRDEGYIYTLVTVTLLLVLLSLIFFYFQVSKPRFADTVTAIRTDELHYFIEAVKRDFTRVASISGQRSATYAINKVIISVAPLDTYAFHPCPSRTSFVYSGTGSPAAIAELMVCGTLDGSSSGSAKYMENNTLIDWTNKTTLFANDIGFVVNMSLIDLKLMPLGAFNFAVLATFDTKAKDADNNSLFTGNISTLSIVPIYALEDPLYLLKTLPFREPDLVPYFTKCDKTPPITATKVGEWIDSDCYHTANKTEAAPSFFDRLDGRVSLSTTYQTQGENMSALLEIPDAADIGLESFANLDKFDAYNVSINVSNTWVDYLYWQNVAGECNVTGMSSHPDFAIDENHGLKYGIIGLVCP